jgi:glycosyltransferase involved in cell wall biosynthesis
MKILAISTWFPFPPDNGSRIRTYNLLKWVGERHVVDLLALMQSPNDRQYLDSVRQFCRRVEVFPEPSFSPMRIRSWIGLFSLVPRYFIAHHSSEMAYMVGNWVKEESYDAVIAVTLGAAPYVVGLDIPVKWLDQHNVESEVIRRRWKSEKSAFGRFRYALTWLKARRFERLVSSSFDVISVVSQNERELMCEILGDSYRDRVVVIPNGVESALLGYKQIKKQSRVLVYSGSLTYFPNYDAALRLCKRVLPKIHQWCSDVRVVITGRTDGVDTQSLKGIPGVCLTGYVEDVRPIVASASVLVVPLRYGGGTKLKVLEAMALGTPVVSTSVGAEGLDVQNGTHILIGESDEELAKLVVALLSDDELYARIVRNAQELVNQRYCWSKIASDFESLLRTFCTGSAKAA